MICPCCKHNALRDEFEMARCKLLSEELEITEAWNPYKYAVVCPKCGVIFIERTE